MAGVTCEHKVRGGSALSLALHRVSPLAAAAAVLVKSSPTDSAASTSTLTASHQQMSLERMSGIDWPSPAASPSTAGAGVQPLAHSAATAPQAAAAAQQREQRRGQGEQQGELREAGQGEHHHHQRWRLPFLACFGSGSAGRLLGDGGSVQQQPAVSASEVGIRPCFYWLESSQPMSEEDRMFAEANARWLKSDCQDDAVVIEHFGGLRHQTFAGVFDGHGPYGRAAAKFASTHLPQLLAAKAGSGGGGHGSSSHGAGRLSERKRLRAMREAFLEVNEAMRDVGQAGFDASLSGTTACCALVVGRKVLVASTGDSRCMVARRAASGELEVVPLTWDAKPSLPEEQKRIAMSGGVVKQLLDERGQRVGAYRVFSRGDDVLPGLAMSRSLGDLYAHEVGVTPEPIMNTYTLGERDLFLILATDGLWDIMGNEEAADFVERYKAARDLHVSCAEALTLEAQERWKSLHDEAIVDDISCVILHTAGLPPPDRDSSVPRPLARAASCNDEANELYQQWRLEKERNPSNHKPKQYFKHLYGGEDDGQQSGGSGSGSGRSSASGRHQAAAAAAVAESTGSAAVDAGSEEGARGQHRLGGAGSPARVSSPPPPASPLRMDAPHYPGYANLSLPGSSGSPQEHSGMRLSALCSPAAGEGTLRRRSSSGGALRSEDALSSQHSPLSSFGDLASEENSEPSLRRGSAFATGGPAWPGQGRTQELLQLKRRSSGPQPIPASRKGSAEEPMVVQSLPIEMMLRPVRKAYPSSGNMQHLATPHTHQTMGAFSYSHAYSYSLRSDTSNVMYAADTPRSGDSSSLERKVRGGMSRSISLQSTARLAHGGGSFGGGLGGSFGGGLSGGGFPSHASLSAAHPSNPSLAASCRTSTDYRGGGSMPGSPTTTDSALGTPLSPQLSPVVVPMGAGYTRVQVGGSRVHSLAPLRSFSSLQSAPHTSPALPGALPPAGAAVHAAVRADLVARGSHLSRHVSDAAGLAEAMSAIDEAEARAAAPSGCAAAAAAAAGPSSGLSGSTPHH